MQYPHGCQVVFTEGRTVVESPDLDARYELYGESPVQGFGTILDRELYFRSRHDEWTFDIADSLGNHPSDGGSRSDGFFRSGPYELASYMPVDVAVRLIDRCLREFIAERTNPTAMR